MRWSRWKNEGGGGDLFLSSLFPVPEISASWGLGALYMFPSDSVAGQSEETYKLGSVAEDPTAHLPGSASPWEPRQHEKRYRYAQMWVVGRRVVMRQDLLQALGYIKGET